MPEDPWSEAYVPGTPEEEARLDAEALGRSPRAPWHSWMGKRPARPAADEDDFMDDVVPPDHDVVDDDFAAEPRRRRTLLVPLALAAVAVVAIAGGVRSRPASPASPPDSVTQSVSAGELDPAAPPATVGAPATLPATLPATPESTTVGSNPGRATGPTPKAAASAASPRATTRATTRAAKPARPGTSATTVRRPRTHGDSLALCATPGIVEQQACLGASLADRDRGLNNVYQTLIREMRRQEGVPVGAPDPPSVQRLRQQQREWLVTRDETCRRESSAASGPLWAAPRVRCLGREGVVRAGVLADRLTRLRAP